MPTPLPTDAAELESALRALIAAELIATASTLPEAIRPKVETRPRYVESEAEWLKIATVKHPQGGVETRVVFLSFDGFTEDDEGACDHTILTLRYGVDVLFSLVDKRRDNSNSHDDFVAYLMQVRSALKANRYFGYARNVLFHTLLQTTQDARVEKIDFAIVHRVNFSLEILVG